MKSLPLALFLTTGAMPVIGQESVDPSPRTGVGDDFGRPAAPLSKVQPVEPKPRLIVSEGDVIRIREVPLGERMVRFEKLRPLSLPRLPAPAQAEFDSEEASAFREAARGSMKDRRFIFVSAEVYVPEGDPSQAKSFVRFWPRQGGKAVSMWVNANMIWLGGSADYQTEDTVYSLMMLCSATSIGKREQVSRLSNSEWHAPEIPDFPRGEASFVVVGGNPEPDDLKPFEALMELYRKDKARLKHAHELRLAHAERRHLEQLANPPDLKNLNIRYWRLDEAGQSGEQPQPAVIR